MAPWQALTLTVYKPVKSSTYKALWRIYREATDPMSFRGLAQNLGIELSSRIYCQPT